MQKYYVLTPRTTHISLKKPGSDHYADAAKAPLNYW